MRDDVRRQHLCEITAQMSHHELCDLMFLNPYGLQNRRAFDSVEHTGKFALIDIDSLKWVNDQYGHEYGDALIRVMSEALDIEFGANAYHMSGDEFVVEAESAITLVGHIHRLQKHLEGVVLGVKDGDYTLTNAVHFSFGIGATLNDADHKMLKHKQKREKLGQRSGRGNPPPNLVQMENIELKAL